MNGVKEGVILDGLKPCMGIIDSVVRDIFRGHLHACVITSAFREPDGKTLHCGYAIDYRTKHIRQQHVKKIIVDDIAEALPMCDVLISNEGRPKECLHVEYDPKDDKNFQRKKKIYKKTGYWPN